MLDISVIPAEAGIRVYKKLKIPFAFSNNLDHNTQNSRPLTLLFVFGLL
jgi:hypothetical protein